MASKIIGLLIGVASVLLCLWNYKNKDRFTWNWAEGLIDILYGFCFMGFCLGFALLTR